MPKFLVEIEDLVKKEVDVYDIYMTIPDPRYKVVVDRKPVNVRRLKRILSVGKDPSGFQVGKFKITRMKE